MTFKDNGKRISHPWNIDIPGPDMLLEENCREICDRMDVIGKQICGE